MEDLVAKLQRHAEELYSARGFNSAAHALLLAADEIVKLRAAVAAEREAMKAELEELRKANEAFEVRQEWWTERMVDLEAQFKEALEAEREEIIAILSRTEFTSLEHMPSEAALIIRMRGGP